MAPTQPADASVPPAGYDYDVFVSYSQADSEWVRGWLLQHLEDAGLRVCIDFRDFDVGKPSLVNMEQAMDNSRRTLLVLTPAWVQSEWTEFESLLIQTDDAAARQRRMLPLLLQPCQPPRRIGILTYADFTNQQQWEDQLQRVIRAVRGELSLRDLGPPLAHLLGASAPFSSLPSLHQLRAPVNGFVGRETEIERLVHALNQVRDGGAAAAISGIQGMGGIGKTELAHLVAAHLAESFPDAQLLLALRGTSEQPVSPVLALASVIRAFEPLAQLPDDPIQLTAIYNSILNGKRVLILADDAHDAAQVRPLLPPAGCALLVTSRRRFTLPGMTSVALDTLPQDEAEQLLLAICPRIGEAALRLAQLCGYLPLALRVSASVLATNATRGIARYIQSLDNERTRLSNLRDLDDPLQDVEASITLSYKALKPAAKQVLCQLSVFPVGFDLGAATTVVALPKPRQVNPAPADTRVEELLGLLYQRSLLDYDERLERYSLHELVRTFAAARLNDETLVRLRYAQHYAQVAAFADSLFLHGHEQSESGLALFDHERAHIDTGWGWARARAGKQVADELLLAYADATTYIGDLRYHSQHERIPQLEAALFAAQRLARKDAQGRFLGNLGSAYYALGNARRAIAFCEEYLTIAREIGDRRGEGAALGNLGSAYYALGDRRRAIAFYKQHLTVAREIGDRRNEGNALGNLGLAYAALGDARRAIAFYKQRLVIAREIGDRHGVGQALGNLGLAYYALGDARRAIAFYNQHLTVAREIGDRRNEGAALGNLGSAYYVLGDAQRAIAFYDKQLTVAREIGDRRNEGAALGNLGSAYYTLGDARRAIALYYQHLTVAREIGDRHGEGNALGNLGSAYYALGDARRAIAFYDQHLKVAREISDRRGEGAALGNLGLAYAALDDARRAIVFYEQCLVIAREIGDRRGEAITSWNLGLRLEEQGDLPRAVDYMQICVDFEREIGHPDAEQDAARLEEVRQRVREDGNEASPAVPSE